MQKPSARVVGEEVRRDGRTLTWIGVALAILGVLGMMMPLMTGLAVTVLVGTLLIAAGIVRMLFAFKASSWGEGIFGALLGLLSLLCGGYLLMRPAQGLAALTLLLVFYLALDGMVELILSWRLRPVEGWGWILFSGALSLLLAVLLWVEFPFSGTWAIGLLVGVKLLFSGFSLVGLGGVADSRPL